MTLDVKHDFVSPKGDGPDATLVRPSNWNAAHKMQMNGPALIGLDTPTTDAAKEIPLGTGLEFKDGTLVNSNKELPVGTVVDYAGVSAPSGWLLCYGQAISRTTYSRLFTALGTTYGNGNGTSTFNVPDLRGRVRAGKDNMGGVSANRLDIDLDGDVLGDTGGSQTNTLTIDDIPAHTHTGNTNNTGNHTHFEFSEVAKADGSPSLAASNAPSWKNNAGGELSYAIQGETLGGLATLGISSSTGAHAHSFETAEAGGGTSHRNVQPTIILNSIIYTGV